MPSSRASAHSAVTTWSWVNPGPRVARPMVSRPSSEGKWVDRTRRTSSPGIASALKNQYFSSDVLALPYAYCARIPVSCSAGIAASGWSGVLLMCDQSTSVVMPALRHSSDPARLEA